MTYCTRQDLINRFGESVIAELEFDNPNAAEEAIADACALIDGYVGGRYTLPLTEVPAIIKRVARDLVRYSMQRDPEGVVVSRRDDAMSYLKDLALGKVTLGIPQASEPDSLDTAEMQNDGHVFSRQNTKGFI